MRQFVIQDSDDEGGLASTPPPDLNTEVSGTKTTPQADNDVVDLESIGTVDQQV